MAIDWSKARQMMTSNPAYRGTRSPTLGANEGKGGQGNFRRTGGRFTPAGGPVPTRQQVAKNRRIATPRGVADYAKGIYNTGKDVAGKFMHPTMMLARSIAANQAQHDYLDDVYGDQKGEAFWNQAMSGFFDRARDAGTIDQRTGQPLSTGYGMSFADMEPGGSGTLGGTSMGQAGKYFTMAGLTQNDLGKFLGSEPSKWAGNEAWLRAQAGGDERSQENFDTAMSFIKNAKATANLARGTQQMEEDARLANLGGPLTPAGGPIPDMDITSDIVPKPKPPMPGADPYNPYRDEDYCEPLWDRGVQPHPNPLLRHGNLGVNDPANAGFPLNITEPYTPYRDEDYFDIDRTAGYGFAGDARANALGNRGYDYDDQTGTIFPNITVEFTGDDEEENTGGAINPLWNQPGFKVRGYGG